MTFVHHGSPSEDPHLTKIVKSSSDSLPPEEVLKELPKKIGRYDVIDVIGCGGLCYVLKCYDPRLDRHVALKIPRLDRRMDNSAWNELLHEARSVAKLKHESIISVIDVDQEDDGTPFVVMEYVDGANLQNYWSSQKFDIQRVLDIVLQIARGLQFIHEHGMVHRDVKPTNIIIDRDGVAQIADFGLALELKTVRNGNGKGSIAGTSKFMAPEQLCGETHRIDERTDLWGLGVVIFWMCTGDYPFIGATFGELREQIKLQGHQHLDECNRKIPSELDRICRKCLSELRQDRYPSINALIEDLIVLSEQLSTFETKDASTRNETQRISRDQHAEIQNLQDTKVVPKGLLPYDEDDAGFFLQLLPGPKDRNGNPDSIRFWLSRIAGSLGNCSHGILYGPAGCGKTSLIRAGLLPRFPKNVEAIYIDCTQHTETSLHGSFTKRLGFAPQENVELSQLFRRVREGAGLPDSQKLVIVLDQFEQYLSQTDDYSESELVDALRHCDGNRISCLISVRDDFWMQTQEFLRLQEVRIQDGRNSQAFQLLDQKHAEEILAKFGAAFGNINQEPGKLAADKQEFLKRAIASISQKGKVNCGHLAILTTVAHGTDWSSNSFDKLGDWQGIVMRFMNETFCDPSAAISRRRLAPQVISIVEALLPPMGERATYCGRTHRELVDFCPSGTSAEDFQDAMTVLERQCRIVKPVLDSSGNTNEIRYHLASDILVDPLRQWIRQQKKLTWRGRAHADLVEYAEIGASQNRHSNYFPSLVSLLRMKVATKDKVLSASESEYLSRGIRSKSIRVLVQAAIVFGLIAIAAFVYARFERHRSAQIAYANYLTGPVSDLEQSLQQFEKLDVDFETYAGEFDPSTASEKFRNALATYRLHDDSDVRERELIESAIDALPEEKALLIKLLGGVSDGHLESVGFEKSLESVEAQSRLAVLAFELGDRQPVLDLMSESDDTPSKMMHLRHQYLENTGLSPEELVDRILDGNEDPRLQQLLMTVLFLDDDTETISPKKIDQTIQVAKTIYRESPDAYAHAIAKWFLLREKVQLPKVTAPEGANWEEIEYGITLARFEGGEYSMTEPDGQNRTYVLDPFYASDLEIVTQLFLDFCNDEEYKDDRPKVIKRDPNPLAKRRLQMVWEHDLDATPTTNLPVVRVSPQHAALFCNWLSKKHGYQPVYDFFEKGFFRPKPDADGYRLPTPNEMDFMMRAGHSGRTFMGDQTPRDWLRHYASFYEFMGDREENEQGERVPAGASKLPNRLGLFDVIGGVDEHTVIFGDNQLRLYAKGFDCACPPRFVFLGRQIDNHEYVNSLHSKCGFRIVRTDK